MSALLPLLACLPLATSSTADRSDVTVENVGLACAGTPTISGPFVGFLVDEADQGATDLDGDGDALDRVLFVLDRRDGRITCTGLVAAGTEVLAADGVFVVGVGEAADGGRDRNGDGDADDLVPALYDAARGLVTYSRLAQSNLPLTLAGGRLFLSVREEDQGGLDRNGDGDATDEVIAWMPLRTPAGAPVARNTGLASVRAVVPCGQWLGIEVRERDQGGRDLNGDGDTDDDVLHLVDLARDTVQDLGHATIGSLSVGGGRLVVRVSEYGDGVDWDGDGVIGYGGILHVLDARTGTMTNTRRSGTYWAASPEIEGLCFFADDSGTYPPYPVQALDVASGRIWPLGTTTRRMLVAWETFVATPSQQSEPTVVVDVLGGTLHTLGGPWYFVHFDGGLLTGYGGNPTGPLYAHDPLIARESLLGATTGSGRTARAGPLAAWLQDEGPAGEDWNGDGDTLDSVLRVYDPAADRVLAFDLAVDRLDEDAHPLAPDAVVFLVSEAFQGGTDLDGDGDATDSVLHVARLDLAASRQERYGAGVPGWRHRVPRLEALGVAAAGRALAPELRRARPDAPGALVVGTAPGARPLFGGELLVGPPFVLAAPFETIALGFEGLARVDLGVLPRELAGTLLFLQAGVVDPDAEGGVALSRGLRLAISP